MNVLDEIIKVWTPRRFLNHLIIYLLVALGSAALFTIAVLIKAVFSL